MGCLSFSGGAVSSVCNHLQQRSPRPGSLASEEKGAHPGGGGGSGGSRPSHPTRRRWRWWWWRWRCGPPSQRGMAPSSVSRSSVRSWLLWAAPEPPPQRMLAATWIRGGKVLEAERLRAICSSLFVFSSREGGGKRREKERKGRKRRGPLLRCPPAAQERGGRRGEGPLARSFFFFFFQRRGLSLQTNDTTPHGPVSPLQILLTTNRLSPGISSYTKVHTGAAGSRGGRARQTLPGPAPRLH